LNILKTIDKIEGEKAEVMIQEIDHVLELEKNPEIKKDLEALKHNLQDHVDDLADNEDARHDMEADIMGLIYKISPKVIGKDQLTADQILSMDLEHNPSLANNLNPAQISELKELQHVLRSMREIDEKQESSLEYMINQLARFVADEKDSQLKKDYRDMLEVLEEHRDNLQISVPARHRLEEMVLETYRDLTGFGISKDEMEELIPEKMRGVTKRQRDVIKCLKNILKHLMEMDDKQEENPVYLAKSMRNMISNEKDLGARHALRELEKFIKHHKANLWDDANLRGEFGELLMKAVHEVLGDWDLESDEFLEMNLKKKDLTDAQRAELVELQTMLHRIKKHEAEDMAKPKHFAKELEEVLGEIEIEAEGPTLDSKNLVGMLGQIQSKIEARSREVSRELRDENQMQNNLFAIMATIKNTAGDLTAENQGELRDKLEHDLTNQINLVLGNDGDFDIDDIEHLDVSH
jgi:hypothetical protein